MSPYVKENKYMNTGGESEEEEGEKILVYYD